MKTCDVEVPAASVSVTDAVYVFADAYVWLVVGIDVVAVWPSPNAQWYDTIGLDGATDPDAENCVACPEPTAAGFGRNAAPRTHISLKR